MLSALRKVLIQIGGSVFLIGCTCAQAGDACLSWGRVGGTYTVEVVQHIDFGIFDGYGFTGHSDRTCGDGFDIRIGDEFTIMDTERAGGIVDVCEEVCYKLTGTFSVPGLTFSDHTASGIQMIGARSLGEEGHVTLGGACSGAYQIGVQRFSRTTSGAGTPVVATNTLLTRGFRRVAGGPACNRPGTRINDADQSQICTDVWAVRVRDADGELLTQDFVTRPTAPRDASLDSGDQDVAAADSGSEDGGG